MIKKKKVNGKQKGNRFELTIAKEIADFLGEEYGKKVRRTPGSGSLLCRADLWVHESLRHRFPWFLELKKRENIRLESILKSNCDLIKWFEESKAKLAIDPEYEITAPSALVFCRNNIPPLILMEYCNYEAFVAIATVDRIGVDHFRLIFYYGGLKYIIIKWDAFLESLKYWQNRGK